ncbi:FHA domain-containing protein [Thiothrix caldifontis]|jgi:FOG: FHA domain|uniref:FHA domain-containing protein n=1 Tax=Thiothrix caldifontis TaxID=525918 RepID=A0A1H3WCA4_9GAMM|nr:FHA domain-containing protein [Thiothrix caldifontis]SDZ84766.1 FHA domain-containing protein [Thiothrix caldifontis]
MATMILEIQTRGLNQYYRLEQFPVTIGRALDNDVILSDNSVSPYHLRLEQDAEGQVFAHNLSSENGTRLNKHQLGLQPVQVPIPSQLLLGNRKLRLASTAMPVETTHVSRCGGLFAPFCQPLWAALLLLLTVVSLLLNDYLNVPVAKEPLFYISGVLPTLVWMLFATLVISGITRLFTHRWEFAPALSVVSLFNLVPMVLEEISGWLSYFLSSDAPFTWLMTGVSGFVLIPALLYVYLHWVLSQKRLPALGIALVLSALPLGLRAISVLDQVTLANEFSSEPYYHQELSSLNIHANPPLPLETYLQRAADALPSQLADE